MGLYGYALPAEYGGLGLSVGQQVLVAIELGYTSPAFRSLFGTNNGIAGQVLVLGGTDEQRKQWLPRLASGEVVASFALTEPDAGSDPSRLATSARAGRGRLGHRRAQALHHQRAGGGRVHGVRAHRPGGAARQGHRGVHRARRHCRGWRWRRGTTRWARPARGPPTSPSPACGSRRRAGRARRPQAGYATAMRSLAHGRLIIAGVCVGVAARLVDESVSYARERTQGGHPIGEYQLVQAMLADSQTEYLAARALVLDARGPVRRGHRPAAGPVGGEVLRQRGGRPDRRPRGADPRRLRATSAACRSSGCTATCGCSGSTRARARSSSSSSPGSCSGSALS